MYKFGFVCALCGVIGAAIVGISHPIWHKQHDVRQSRNTERPGTGTRESLIAGDAYDVNISELAEEKQNADARANSQSVGPTVPVTVPRTGDHEDSSSVGELANRLGGLPVDSAGRELPATYKPLVEPPSAPERLTTQELYERFVEDGRDEAWAYSMELGMSQFIENRGAEFGATFEFVSCGSRYCMIAGAIYGGGQSAYDGMMAEMTQAGWWQAFGGNNTTGYSTDTEYRFVSILPRTYGDGSRVDSSGQSQVTNATPGRQ